MTMMPYAKLPEDVRREDIKFTFPPYDDITVVDWYCGNPECECEDISLACFGKDAAGWSTVPLFMFHYNLASDALGKVQKEGEVDNETMRGLMDTFKAWVTDGGKPRLRARMAEVKAATKNDPTLYIDLTDHDMENCLHYSELFHGKEVGEELRFMLGPNEFVVVDQYCIDPLCQCNHAILEFFQLQKGIRKTRPILAVDYGFDGSYNFLIRECPKYLGKELLREAIRQIPQFTEILAKRYERMKKVGVKTIGQKVERGLGGGMRRIAAERQRTSKKKKEKVGRNDPCPCGSGKKYKICCGKRG